MLVDNIGPVSLLETQEVVRDIRCLSARALEHGQTFLAMALDLAAESIADNVETSMDMDADADHG